MIDGILLKMWIAPSLEKESIEMVLIYEINHLWTTYERFKKLESKDDLTKQLAMLMRMNGYVDNQMTTRLMKTASLALLTRCCSHLSTGSGVLKRDMHSQLRHSHDSKTLLTAGL